MFDSPRPVLSTVCTILASLAFLFGAQSRITSRFTPEINQEQHKKTAESQKEMYTLLRITPEQCTRLIGYVNLVATGGLIWTQTRRLTAAALVLWLCTGAFGRFRTGRSVLPPLVIMMVLLGAMA